MKIQAILLSLCIGMGLAAAPEVVSARYGAGDSFKDVTEILRQKVKEGATEIKITEATFGDPAPWLPKQLQLEIRENGKTYQINGTDTVPLTLEKWNASRARLPEVQRKIEDAYARGDKKISLTPGTYRIQYSPLQSTHLSFYHLRDFEIDATGCTFILTDPARPAIEFVHCRNLTFKGATFLRETPTFSQGTVKAVTKDYVDVEIHAGYPSDFDDPGFRRTPVLTFFDGKNRRIKPGLEGEAGVNGIEKLGDRLYRIKATSPCLGMLKPGDLAAWRRVEGARGEMNVVYCKDSTFENITIKNSLCCCIKESGGENNHYQKYIVTYANPPKGAVQKPLLASAADGFYCEFDRKGPTIENSIIEGTHDDSVNINGKIWRVKKIDGNTVDIAYCIKLPEPGDLFKFFGEQHEPVSEGKVVSAKKIDGGTLRLELDRPISPNSKSAVNWSCSGNGFVIRNLITRNHRNRGLLLRGANGLVENSLFEDLGKAGIIVQPEFLWADEGPYAENLTIRNNVLRRCSVDCYGVGGAMSVISHQPMNWKNPGAGPWRYVPFANGHRNIVIENNRFEDCIGPNLAISSATGVKVRNNVFINPLHRSTFFNRYEGFPDPEALSFVVYSKDVEFSGNRVEKPGKAMKKLVATTPDVDSSRFDKGFTVRK